MTPVGAHKWCAYPALDPRPLQGVLKFFFELNWGAMPTALRGHVSGLEHGHSEQWPWHQHFHTRS